MVELLVIDIISSLLTRVLRNSKIRILHRIWFIGRRNQQYNLIDICSWCRFRN